MTFSLGAKSRANLAGVHPKLIAVVEGAIEITSQDFIVYEGLRAFRTQTDNIANGVSWTMKSRHLCQADGFAHAVDLVPWINRLPTWDWAGWYRIAAAMGRVAGEQDIALIWGGVWDRPMALYASDEEAIVAENKAYVARRRAGGRRAAIDGPHYELA